MRHMQLHALSTCQYQCHGQRRALLADGRHKGRRHRPEPQAIPSAAQVDVSSKVDSPPVKAVLFDMDGVLCASESLSRR